MDSAVISVLFYLKYSWNGIMSTSCSGLQREHCLRGVYPPLSGGSHPPPTSAPLNPPPPRPMVMVHVYMYALYLSQVGVLEREEIIKDTR